MSATLNGVSVVETTQEGGEGFVENECPICGTIFYIAEPDFNSGQSCFCPNAKCNFWLRLDNESNERKENEKKRTLASLNERRQIKTKKFQRQDFNNKHQSTLIEEVK